jgi:hypothetical protein
VSQPGPEQPAPSPELAAENAALRARVDSLEAEVATLRAETVKTVAAAQETLYWFERWGVDFNSLMRRPQMEFLRKSLRALRSGYRGLLKAKRTILK